MKTCLSLGLLCLVLSVSGCAMCAHPDDWAYGTYGGLLPRGDQYHGRVGSLLDPADGGYVHGGEVLGPQVPGEYYESPPGEAIPPGEELPPGELEPMGREIIIEGPQF